MDKELFLMRHAKSSWDSDVSDDSSRPLSKRGINAAKRIGNGLNQLGWIPDLLLVSPSQRTQQTLEQINLDTKAVILDQLYEASLDDLFTLISDTPESVTKLMLLGHNPSLEQLLLYLAPNAERQKNGKLFTTANVARIGINGRWSTIKKNKDSSLLGLIRPKELD